MDPLKGAGDGQEFYLLFLLPSGTSSLVNALIAVIIPTAVSM